MTDSSSPAAIAVVAVAVADVVGADDEVDVGPGLPLLVADPPLERRVSDGDVIEHRGNGRRPIGAATGTEYLLVGGLAARAHGAQRRTDDVDRVPNTLKQNLERLAAALRELNARLRVGSMSDDEARRLPVVVNAATLESFGSSTWMTGAGPVDLLVELRDRDGGRHSYRELARRAVRYEVGGVTVWLASLDDIIGSKEFAGREKDREGLPELHGLRSGLRDPE